MTQEEFDTMVKLIQAIASRAIYEAACRERRLFVTCELSDLREYENAKRILVKEPQR
jgi:hypothetical protein